METIQGGENHEKIFSSIRNPKLFILSGVILLMLVSWLAGMTMASNMGFKLNHGIITALNSLFKPSGYNQEGQWIGTGSGILFSISEGEESSDTTSLNIQTPIGTISLPYAPAPELFKSDKTPGRSYNLMATDEGITIHLAGTGNLYEEVSLKPERLALASADGGYWAFSQNGQVTYTDRNGQTLYVVRPADMQ